MGIAAGYSESGSSVPRTVVYDLTGCEWRTVGYCSNCEELRWKLIELSNADATCRKYIMSMSTNHILPGIPSTTPGTQK